ncbi:PAS domain-containing protein [Candidatus Saccharibacteria bacterium]|nr:PAS domain-containing protein [Candidatus Saccharibacteria bacterium]
MGLFNLKKNKTKNVAPLQPAAPAASGKGGDVASTVLGVIHDGVVMTDRVGAVQYMNPAAARLCGASSPNDALGLDVLLIIRIETKEGRELPEADNPFIQAIRTGQTLKPYECNIMVGQTDKRVPISLSVLPANETGNCRIITFRDITEELKEEGEQMEFISTASHEMRTPVATIDGYLALCLNPATATIDERAHNYLTAAHAASQHLGKLFQDLLDVTKLDDSRVQPKFVPAEMIEMVKDITKDYIPRAEEKKINFTFGADDSAAVANKLNINQVVYGYVDPDFMREILDNLIDNALKYTPSGGSIYINVRGDGDRVLINVTDTGMGISSDDLGHIFQKFYRADNSDTRTIGGTGLGLYIVKQRTEAMGGQVWAESAFGEGSTFYVSLPRLTADEYEKRMIPIRNQKMQEQLNSIHAQPVVPVQAQPEGLVQPIAPVQAQLADLVQPTVPVQPQPAVSAQVQPEMMQQVAQPEMQAQPTMAQPVVQQPIMAQPVEQSVAQSVEQQVGQQPVEQPAMQQPIMEQPQPAMQSAIQQAPEMQPVMQQLPDMQPVMQQSGLSNVQPMPPNISPQSIPPAMEAPELTPQSSPIINNNLNGGNV